jgi:tungstate transport system ATP-binding protein
VKLHIDNIRKQYDGRNVLNGCSYRFDESGVYVLMGANGCGKSTLLRICSLLEPPDDGELLFSDSGIRFPHSIQLRRRMTLVLPRTGVFNATVFQNVSYGLRVRHFSSAAIRESVMRSLTFVGLEGYTDRHALTLSSGETQRMGIARALVLEPEILFLDEPTASIDEENARIVEDIILSMRKQGRTTVIMTTHDRDQANRLADRVLHLHSGTLSDGS